MSGSGGGAAATAFKEGDYKELRRLLKKCNGDPDFAVPCTLEAAESGQSWPAVMQAVVEGDAKMVGLLLRCDADPDARCSLEDGTACTALHLAAVRTAPDALEVVELLLGAGASPALVDHDGWTACDRAILRAKAPNMKGNLPVLKLLHARGGKGDQPHPGLPGSDAYDAGWLPIHTACRHGRLDAARFLLDQGINAATSRDRRGRTPLHSLFELERGTMEHKAALMAALIQKGANPRATDKDGCEPGSVAADRGEEGQWSTLRKLLLKAATAAEAKDREMGFGGSGGLAAAAFLGRVKRKATRKGGTAAGSAAGGRGRGAGGGSGVVGGG